MEHMWQTKAKNDKKMQNHDKVKSWKKDSTMILKKNALSVENNILLNPGMELDTDS